MSKPLMRIYIFKVAVQWIYSVFHQIYKIQDKIFLSCCNRRIQQWLENSYFILSKFENNVIKNYISNFSESSKSKFYNYLHYSIKNFQISNSINLNLRQLWTKRNSIGIIDIFTDYIPSVLFIYHCIFIYHW